MDTTVHDLFNPLCVRGEGVTPVVGGLPEAPGVRLELRSTGRFCNEGARPMDDAFATYAWATDSRIECLTGQRFTEQYRRRALGDRWWVFDSAPTTGALTAVSLPHPARKLEALEAIPHARYVNGSDVKSMTTLFGDLEALDLKDAAARLAHPKADLLGASRTRMGRAQALMREFCARGVPFMLVASGAKRWVLNRAAVYSNPHALLSQLEAARATCALFAGPSWKTPSTQP